MSANPQDLAQQIWELLQARDQDTIDQADCPLVGELRSSLGLPEQPAFLTPITIPGRQGEAAVVLEGQPSGYLARVGRSVPIEFETRRGTLVVDPDDPLAQAQRSIENLEALEL